MNVLCINLERATERRTTMRRAWEEERGFTLEFFPAWDRREVLAGRLPEGWVYDPARAAAIAGRELSAGEIAVGVSFGLALQAALARGWEEVVVLEDDVWPATAMTTAELARVTAVFREEFPRAAALLLHEHASGWAERETRGGIALLARPPLGCHGVYFTRAGMALMARDLASLTLPADWWWTRRWAPLRLVAACVPPLCGSDDADTYVGSELRGGEARRFIP